MENQIPQEFQETISLRSKLFGKAKEKPLIFLLAFIVFLGVVMSSAVLVTKDPNTDPDEKNPNSKFISNDSIVYGYWADNSSVIDVVDLSNGENANLAVLPFNIKHVKVIDSDNISYINNTDERDYGSEIIIRTLSSKAEKTIIKADKDFGIDDYRISPNKRYAAVWEVSPPDGSTELIGGRSRVYTVDVNNITNKHLIYDQSSGPGQPVDYPIAITNTGELFTDKFLPNSGAGWGYGMSASDFTGTSKQMLVNMENGTISSQPMVSRDGTKLVFSGYDGSKGPGDEELDGYRRAMIVPNTVETFNLLNRERKKIVDAEADINYVDVRWDLLKDEILYSRISKNPINNGTFSLNTAINISDEINSVDTEAPNNQILTRIYGSLSNNKSLVITEETAQDYLGNLGGKYSSLVSSMFAQDNKGQKQEIKLNSSLSQIIDVLGSNIYSNLTGDTEESKKQLQLYSFELKPTLAPKRSEQQANPPKNKTPFVNPTTCGAKSVKLCNVLMEKDYPLDVMKNRQWNNNYPEDDEFFGCTLKAWLDLQGSCYDSPLYLYGAEGSRIGINIGTPIYSVNTNYSPSTGFDVVLGKNGKFYANGESVFSLEFDYKPAIKITKPEKGYAVSKKYVEKTISSIAKGLVLNEKETEDTIASVKQKITSDYVFISFYDHEISQKILPIAFSLVPDTYRNIVFYIENLSEKPNASYEPPIVEKILRNGFTAIEISFIVK